MPTPQMSSSERTRNLVAIVFALSAAALIHGLTLPLLSLMMHANGIDATLIGTSAAVQSAAIVLVSPLLPAPMSRFGPVALILGALSVTLLAFAALPVFTSVEAWFVLRFVIGAAGSCLWVCGEVWVNQVSSDGARGRTVALYSMSVAGGFALGPFVLSLTGSSGPAPFVVASAVLVLAALPILSVAHIAPKLHGERSGGFWGYLWLAPVAMSLCALYALTEGVILTFLPLYGIAIGLSEAGALHLITMLGIGGIVGPAPIGWLADRMDRMLLAALSTVAVFAAAVAMPWVLPIRPWNLLFMLAFGAIIAGLYNVALTIIGERFRGADLAAASAMFGVMWGAGSILGPPLGGIATELHPHGVPLVLAAIFAAFVPLPAAAWLRRRKRPDGDGPHDGTAAGG